MLSICIPTYNYDVRPLVVELHQQAILAGIACEILVADDCSSDRAVAEQNKIVEELSQVSILEMSMNVGRSAIRNQLAAQAQYHQLLFLDCDTFPENSNFIQNYWANRLENGVVVGGLVYRNEKPSAEFSLRWTYGHERETISAEQRSLNCYSSFMTGNFLIAKPIFDQLKFDETVVRYGHEDTIFGIMLEKEQIPVRHISNRVYHDGLETNSIFIQKTKAGIKNLLDLYQNHPLKEQIVSKIRLLKTFQLVKKAGMVSLLGWWFKSREDRLLMKIESPNPNLRSFDWFKLGYLCFISKKG